MFMTSFSKVHFPSTLLLTFHGPISCLWSFSASPDSQHSVFSWWMMIFAGQMGRKFLNSLLLTQWEMITLTLTEIFTNQMKKLQCNGKRTSESSDIRWTWFWLFELSVSAERLVCVVSTLFSNILRISRSCQVSWCPCHPFHHAFCSCLLWNLWQGPWNICSCNSASRSSDPPTSHHLCESVGMGIVVNRISFGYIHGPKGLLF